ncbi:hypothetical protein BDZ45DRAFT_794956, partial [Acephala macrosclerotiorum]
MPFAPSNACHFRGHVSSARREISQPNPTPSPTYLFHAMSQSTAKRNYEVTQKRSYNMTHGAAKSEEDTAQKMPAEKIRYSRTDPCINCSIAGVACAFRSDDSKR